MKNKEQDKRLQYLTCGDSMGGCTRFTGATLEILKNLEALKYLDLEEQQNNAPNVGEFLEIMAEFKELGVDPQAHGYVVTPERADSRISLEGLYVERPKGMRSDNWIVIIEKFSEKFRTADDFTITSDKLYCWFD